LEGKASNQSESEKVGLFEAEEKRGEDAIFVPV